MINRVLFTGLLVVAAGLVAVLASLLLWQPQVFAQTEVVELTERIIDPGVQKWLKRLPVARAGQPEDMVAGVLYLVSDEAAYTTGTTLVMDGGATLG